MPVKILQGIDLVKISRMDASVKKQGKRFLERTFAPAERAYCEARRKRFEHYAARFAAKEALLKALKLKLPAGDYAGIEIKHEPSGKPYVSLSPAVRKKTTLGPDDQIELSLAHERDYAIATVVVVRSQNQVLSRSDPRRGRHRPR